MNYDAFKLNSNKSNVLLATKIIDDGSYNNYIFYTIGEGSITVDDTDPLNPVASTDISDTDYNNLEEFVRFCAKIMAEGDLSACAKEERAEGIMCISNTISQAMWLTDKATMLLMLSGGQRILNPLEFITIDGVSYLAVKESK